MANGFIQSVETGEHPHCPPVSKTGKSGATGSSSSADATSEMLVSLRYVFILRLLDMHLNNCAKKLGSINFCDKFIKIRRVNTVHRNN